MLLFALARFRLRKRERDQEETHQASGNDDDAAEGRADDWGPRVKNGSLLIIFRMLFSCPSQLMTLLDTG